MASDRLSIRRGEWDCEPPDALPHLISFIVRGPRGKVKAHVCVDKRLARRYYDDLGELLGEPRSGGWVAEREAEVERAEEQRDELLREIEAYKVRRDALGGEPGADLAPLYRAVAAIRK